MVMVAKNNPFNIRFSKNNRWFGQNGQNKGFVRFSSLDCGIRAMIILLRNYRKFGLNTIKGIVNRFAPPTENNTDAYLRFVAKETQILLDQKLESEDQYIRLMYAMSVFEGNPVPRDIIVDVLTRFELKFFSPYEEKNIKVD